MTDYFITYVKTNEDINRTVTVTALDASHARDTLKRVMPGIIIKTCLKIPKTKRKSS